jgi:double-stranded uracil-DNA glycosylase
VKSSLLKASFDAVTDTNTRVVIFGSLPGEISLERQQYYANPTNQFWRLAGAVIERDLVALDYADRLRALLDTGVGLWDVVKTARRQGSGDSAITDHAAHLLPDFAKSLPRIEAFAFNGGKAAQIGRRQMAGTHDPALVNLPSSSAAYCAISFERKLEKWIALRACLG